MTRKRKWLVGVVVVVALLVATRIALPFIVKDVINRRLGALQAYHGQVGDIDIHLWRGAYSADDLVIEKRGAKSRELFFKTRRLDLAVEWRSLLHGKVVGAAEFDSPELNLVHAESKKDEQLGQEEDWHARLEDLFPIRFNTVRVADGTVHFLAPGIQARDAITAHHVHGQVSNLTNVVSTGKETFADFELEAEVLGDAPAKVAGSVDPFAKQPTFDVNMQVKKVQLPRINPWLRQYVKADAEAGKFELYMEMAAADGRFKGYAKPILQDVDMYRSGEPEKNPLKRAWEGFLDFAAGVLNNKQADQVAARIPFTGTIKDPQTSLFATIASVLHNAFISAFARSLEGSITLRDVKKNLNELDPNQDSKEKKKDEDKHDEEVAHKPRGGPPGKS